MSAAVPSASSATSSDSNKSKSLLEFIQQLSDKSVNTLYSSPAACLAVFRQLPCLAQAFIYRQLFSADIARQLSVLTQWTSPNAKDEVNQICRLLRDLHIWKAEPSSSAASSTSSVAVVADDVKVRFNPVFKLHLYECIFGGSKALLEDLPSTPEERQRVSPEILANTAQQRWDRILHYMTGLTGESESISETVRDVLQTAGLMRRVDANARTLEITSDGFRFLLLDRPAQVWKIINGYVTYIQQKSYDLAECLAFLFELSFARVGQPYNKSENCRLKKMHQLILEHLRHFGLIFMSSKDVTRFYCTGLVTLIGQGGKMDAVSMQAMEAVGVTNTTEQGYLIVETNFRVYAYTESPLKIATLAFFCEMIYRFPQMAIGIITRESVREALLHGISAEEIIHFLETRSHPQVIENVAKHNENELVLMPKPLLPASLTDQIRLWEMEIKRYTIHDAVAYSGFNGQDEYAKLKKFCDESQFLICANDNSRVVVAKGNAHENVKQFWKRQKKEKD